MTRPYIKNTVKKVGELSKEAGVKAQQGYDWVEANYGDTLRVTSSKAKHWTLEAKQWVLEAWVLTSAKCVELYKDFIPTLARSWEQVEPFFLEVAHKVTKAVLEVHTAVQDNFPVYMEWLKVSAEKAYLNVSQYVNQLMA
jgi:hypothetical protein